MTYDWEEDALRSWELAIASLREICIRRKQILPRSDHPDELRWAEEGERGPDELDTVKR